MRAFVIRLKADHSADRALALVTRLDEFDFSILEKRFFIKKIVSFFYSFALLLD